MKHVYLFLLSCIAISPILHAQKWQSRGIGGGGALFVPSINPDNDKEFYVACDVSAMYHTYSFGHYYDTVPFTQFQATTRCKISFTSDPNVLYSLRHNPATFVELPSRSLDGGKTWQFLPGILNIREKCYYTFSNYDDPNMVIYSDYKNLFISKDKGQTVSLKWSEPALHLAGVFFDGNTIYIATNVGMLVSTDGGSNFAKMDIAGIPANESMLRFSGAKQNGITRFFTLTGDKTKVYPRDFQNGWWELAKNIYSLDNIIGSWIPKNTGFDPSKHYVFMMDMATNDISTVYLAGIPSDASAPLVLKTTDAGNSWNKAFKNVNNENIKTAYCGVGNPAFNWWWAGIAVGFTVAPKNANKAIVTDYGFIHTTDDGGNTWQQAYTDFDDTNPANTLSLPKKTYHGIGLEQTGCWQVNWMDDKNMFACYTDIRGIRSTDGGYGWSFDYTGHTENTMFRMAKHPSQNTWFAASSTIHDVYQTTYITDARLFQNIADGRVLFSNDKGVTWNLMKDFGKPVIWVTTDPNMPNRLYAGVIDKNSANGGVWMADNTNDPATATWTKLPNPPANNGRIYNINVLNDGTLVTSWSARLADAGLPFSDSSGVFITSNLGVTWEKRSHTDMKYYTKDVVIDPHDATQNTWYAGAWSGWGGLANDKGGLYRTKDRGLTWQKITAFQQFHRVSSVTISPTNPEQMYLTTETEGLWITNNLSAAMPTFSLVTGFPYSHPERVFFNPYRPQDVWVGTFGNGMYLYHPDCTIAPTVIGTIDVCESSISVYTTPLVANTAYKWTVLGGNILSGQGSNTIRVKWNSEKTGNVTVEVKQP
jgi:photosystem II stability/assembly factor-like uncharacterized protein